MCVGQLYTIPQVADRLQVSKSWLEKQVANRQVEFTKIGRNVRFSDEQVVGLGSLQLPQPGRRQKKKAS